MRTVLWLFSKTQITSFKLVQCEINNLITRFALIRNYIVFRPFSRSMGYDRRFAMDFYMYEPAPTCSWWAPHCISEHLQCVFWELPPYCVSKGPPARIIEQIPLTTRSLAASWTPQIRVSSLDPGQTIEEPTAVSPGISRSRMSIQGGAVSDVTSFSSLQLNTFQANLTGIDKSESIEKLQMGSSVVVSLFTSQGQGQLTDGFLPKSMRAKPWSAIKNRTSPRITSIQQITDAVRTWRTSSARLESSAIPEAASQIRPSRIGLAKDILGKSRQAFPPPAKVVISPSEQSCFGESIQNLYTLNCKSDSDLWGYLPVKVISVRHRDVTYNSRLVK